MLVTLNQALANGHMAFPDAMVKKHPEFIMFGAGNTFGNGATAQFVGRSPQDGAFMDRFIKWVVDVDHNVEDAMVNAVPMESELRDKWINIIRTCRTNAESKGLRVMVTPRQTVRGAQMLATGKFSIKEVVMSQFGFGLDSNQFAKVTEGVTL
jgi:cobaltochelatase CobS